VPLALGTRRSTSLQWPETSRILGIGSVVELPHQNHRDQNNRNRYLSWRLWTALASARIQYGGARAVSWIFRIVGGISGISPLRIHRQTEPDPGLVRGSDYPGSKSDPTPRIAINTIERGLPFYLKSQLNFDFAAILKLRIQDSLNSQGQIGYRKPPGKRSKCYVNWLSEFHTNLERSRM
jgi:hypothetical protein